jgi:molybdate transport system substrate-binding protein
VLDLARRVRILRLDLRASYAMSAPLTVVSSMATRTLLAELTRSFERRSEQAVALEAVGGVDVARRVRAGEDFDAVVLASNAIDALLADGHLVPGTKRDVATSGVAIAVRRGDPRPEIGSEDAVRRAVLAARTIGHSTGPSGVELVALFERWGILDEVRGRLVVAPAGVPVGLLIERGEAELGFQQLSELAHVEGIEVLGPLPAGIQIVTTFSAAVGSRSSQPDLARALLEFLASSTTADAKRREGMEPA